MSVKDQLLWFKNLKDSPSFMAESNKIGFACEIERALAANGISQNKLADMIGVTPAYVSKVLKGDANLTIETMTKFSDAIGKVLHLYLANKGAKVEWVETFTDVESPVSSIDKETIYTNFGGTVFWGHDDSAVSYWSTLTIKESEIPNNVN